MGNSGSSSASDPRFASATRAFTPNELEELKSLFESLAARSESNGKYISPSVFKAYIGIDGPIGDRVFDVVSQKRKDQKLTFEDLVISKGTYEKGIDEDIDEFIYQLIDISADGIVTRSDLVIVINTMFDNLFHKQYLSDPNTKSSSEIIEAFLPDKVSTNEGLLFEDFRKWCALQPSVRKFLCTLLIPSESGSQIPQLLHQDSISPNLVVLKKEYAWHIGGALAHHELEEWRLLYHSGVHGLSFNTFLGNILDLPTVLIIKDKDGYIYGGYASQSWERHGDFYGDMKSFLFQLHPKASIFRPSGVNTNIQWCAVNFSSDSIPNGIGLGGRVNHFGLFLSATFDQGQSFPCTTFGSPCLSKTHRLYPEVIECWGVVTKGLDQDRPEALKGTVLERFKEDRHMLNMVGLANSSE